MNNPWYLTAQRDPKLFWAEYGELRRQIFGLEMIASENMPSEAVVGAIGSVANNKYAEGYPGKARRYYGGCDYVDVGEQTAIDRANILFGARHANVQPHSGTNANQAVFFALMDPGDTILSMNLDHGGHLSHGSSVNAIGQNYNIVNYGVGRDGFIDYTRVRELAKKVRPRVIIAGGSAYPRTIDFEKFRQIADEVDAYLVADIAHPAGLIAAGLHPSPINFAHVTTTTTHKTLRGPRGGMVLLGKDYDLTVHKKNDPRYPMPIHRAIDTAVFPGMQGGPLEHVILAKAIAFGESLNADRTGVNPDFVLYQKSVMDNASALARFLLERGYTLSSDGTDNHLVLLKNPRGMTGKCAQYATELIGITTNKNAVPDDTEKPWISSGLRLGTPTITTRGIGEEGTLLIAESIDQLFSNTRESADHTPIADQAVVAKLKPRIDEVCRQYPIYTGRLAMFEFIINELRLQR
ncbi:serine hydroxymethyltransferase [Candidatus Woesearchaeota archaeon]|nr:serine hydroxymethyltransferase [Candidatus Woesearchaeota archaeon]